MTKNSKISSFVATALLLSGYFATATVIRAAETPDSAQITKLFADAKTESTQLVRDSEEMETYTRSKLSWEHYASKIELIKQHINNTGVLLTQLQDAESTASAWQKTAIQRIEPTLKELASNTEATIAHLNDNPAKVHLPEFRAYVKANYALAASLDALVRDIVSYGEAKGRADRLAESLGVDK